MKRIIYLLIAGLLFSNCSHRIVRTGYQIKKSDYITCDVVIKKNPFVADTSAIKIGEIKLGESGFSVACSEADAIQILRNEACALHADIVNIIEENRPDLWSSCYRCRAEFYKYNISQINPKSNELYKPENVRKRVSQDRKQNTVVAFLAVGIGVIIGLLLVQ
jgi:hypothetical protein